MYSLVQNILCEQAGLMRAAGSPHTISIGGSFKARMERDRKITIMVAIMVRRKPYYINGNKPSRLSNKDYMCLTLKSFEL